MEQHKAINHSFPPGNLLLASNVQHPKLPCTLQKHAPKERTLSHMSSPEEHDGVKNKPNKTHVYNQLS